MRTILAMILLGATIALPLVAAQTGTCMDGQQGNESCDPNVRYLGGPSPSGGANETPQTNDPPAPPKVVPALAAAGIVGAAVLATLFVSRSRW